MKKGVYIMRDARRLPPRLQRITRQQSRQHLCRTHGGAAFDQLALQRAPEGSRGLQRAPEGSRGCFRRQLSAGSCLGLPQAPTGLRQSAAWSALDGHTGLAFDIGQRVSGRTRYLGWGRGC